VTNIPNNVTDRQLAQPLRDPIFLAILLATLACRVYLVVASDYIYDETETWISATERISFEPGELNLPIRNVQHPALPAYLMKFSSAIFGCNPFGYRLPNLIAGLVSVVVIYRLGSRWGGVVVGRWAALLLAFNEYHLAMHSVATEEGLYLCLVLLSLWAFTRFLDSEHPGWLFAAAACLGVGFLCSEISALMPPVYFISLLALPHRRWLRRPQPWLAALLFFVIISPDVWHNFATPPESVPQPYANYADHLSRIGGIGLSEQPLVFYFRYAMERLHIPHENTFNEMPSMNPIFGLVLLGAVVLATMRRDKGRPANDSPVSAAEGVESASCFSSGTKKDATTVTLLIMFWLVFAFFSLLSPKLPSREGVHLDAGSWIWVDTNLFPAALLAGSLLARLRGKWAATACGLALVLVLYVGWQVAALRIWEFR